MWNTSRSWSGPGWSILRRGGGGGVVIPNAANLRGYVEGNNLDGLNNTTLTNGLTVAAVNNLGTLGGMFANAVALQQPTFSTTAGPGGTKPALTLDGGDWLTSTLAATDWAFLHDGNGATIYTVVKTSTSAVHTIVSTCNGGGTAIGIIHRYNVGFAASYAMNDGVALRIAANAAAASVANGSFDLYASTLASADTPDLSMYVNGVSVQTANSVGFTAAAPASTLVIGATPSATFPMTGSLRRIMIFQGADTPAQVAAVRAYSQALDAVTYPAP